MALLDFISALQGARGKNNPGNAASPYLNRLPQYGHNAYDPFIQQGQQASNILNPIQNQYAQDPQGIYNNILSQYAPSAGYQFKQKELGGQLHNTAAAGGFAGTQGHQQQHAELINSLLGADMQEFLKNILSIQGTGMKGLDTRVERGYGASGSLADYLGGTDIMRARNAGATTDYRNQARENVYSSLSSLIGQLSSGWGGK